jgi:glutamate/tyrosine decarboxylase-like PLP-dependent enzyme
VSIDSPEFLAFIPNAPTKNSMLFDMVVACSGLNGTTWLEAAGVVVAENQALEFLAARAGLPAGAGGAFASGGTTGNLSALTVARDVGRLRHPELNGAVRIALSSEAHSSVGKALHIIGVEPLYVTPENHRLTRAAVDAALAADPHPESVVAIVATAGTTNAGIVDDLEGIGELCRATDRWFHVDGAYGGAGMFSSTHGHLYTGMRHVDSFIVDPHKWLYGPLDACALIWREPHVARRILAQQASYLDIIHQHDDDEHYEWNPSDFAIMLSRRARGLPFWFSLASYGVNAYETAVQASIDIAYEAARLIEAADHVEIVRPVELSIVLFRRLGWSEADYVAWSKQLLRDQIAFVTPSKWEGEACARLAFLHPDTTKETVQAILDSMR